MSDEEIYGRGGSGVSDESEFGFGTTPTVSKP